MVKDLNKLNLSTSNSSKAKNFILKCMIMFLIVVGYILSLIPQFDTAYGGALEDKVIRLMEIDEPKIVLIGNSNVAFGFDSEYIQSEMGMPVVNMGYHGGLGNTFHNNMMDYNIHEGDIYVIAHSSYWNSGKVDNALDAWVTIENRTVLWHLIKPQDYLTMVKGFPAYVKKCVDSHINHNDLKIIDSAYNRDSFNIYGDVVYERSYSGADFRDDIWMPVVSEEEVTDINEWNAYLKSKGATMVITAFPLIIDQWPFDGELMDEYQEALEDRMDCRVISNWRDYTYNSEMFYDSQYHLTNEGARLRSEQLVKDLKKWQEEINE